MAKMKTFPKLPGKVKLTANVAAKIRAKAEKLLAR